ncbi:MULTISPECIES: class I SAM-dependent methyltransferase [Gemella]|uniref:class I SAM-dependent methyltransferase n=1 Tax=Gemella TaxID=1378 RepID=UPI000767F8C5|nr:MULTISPECIES: class I SAM-dependent methyltransferase [Gemella]AME08694.1 conjugal transfer protein [Gemella sp. oral taxon 928]AXI26271.1 class I SAM-dependent methyltransferase [Gemella sp. ND 6198]
MNEQNILKGVEDTLYIPLVARIYASKKFPEFFYDKKALSLEKYIPANSIKENTTEYFYMASVCRQYIIDQKITRFLEKNDLCNVVFLGAGLETAFNRIGNTKAYFYQVDLPNVIEIRKQVLGKAENETLISGDMFTLDWAKEIDVSLPTLIVVSGVYQYFKEDKILSMIKRMQDNISKGELIFDVTNSTGLKLANKYVKKTGNSAAQMYFSIDNPIEFADKTQTELISVDGFFKDALKICKNLKLKTRVYMYFADKLNRTLIVYLKFKN